MKKATEKRKVPPGIRQRYSRLFWLGGAVMLGLILVAIQAWIWRQHIHAYDDLIEQVAADVRVDPALIRAVALRESRMNANAVGGVGERGLMQVTETVGQEWAALHEVADFQPDDLFDPETNLRVGAWYLRRALDHWSDRTDPLPYALAQYNAGRSNALRWAQDDEHNPERFLEQITFPSTRAYVADVMRRYRSTLASAP